MVEHTYAQNYLFSLTLFTCIVHVLSPRMVYIKLSNFILFHLKMMTWSHRKVVSNSFCLFLLLDV